MAAKIKTLKAPVARRVTDKAVPAKARETSPAATAPAAKTTPVKVASASPVVPKTSAQAGQVSSVLKMKDLIDKVVAATGAKKADVRGIIEATLAALGDALSKGNTLNLPPFGRAKVSRAAEAGSGKAMTVKLRRNGAAASGVAQGKQNLADAEDDF